MMTTNTQAISALTCLAFAASASATTTLDSTNNKSSFGRGIG